MKENRSSESRSIPTFRKRRTPEQFDLVEDGVKFFREPSQGIGKRRFSRRGARVESTPTSSGAWVFDATKPPIITNTADNDQTGGVGKGDNSHIGGIDFPIDVLGGGKGGGNGSDRWTETGGPEEEERREYLLDAFVQIDLDMEYDVLIPTSVEAFKILLSTGYLPSVRDGGYIRGYDIATLRELVEKRSTDRLHVLPLFDARRIAQTHGGLSSDGDEAEKFGDSYQGVLIAIISPAGQQTQDQIHYSQVEALIGIGQDNREIVELLGTTPDHPAARVSPYVIGDTPIELIAPDITKFSSKDPYVQIEAFAQKIESSSYRKKIADTLRKTLNAPVTIDRPEYNPELVHGYFSTPSYEETIETSSVDVPEIGIVECQTVGSGVYEPLLTQEVLNAYADSHGIDSAVATRVGNALFAPFIDGGDAFNEWKKAGLYLRIFGPDSTQGIETSSIIHANAPERNWLENLQGLEAGDMDLLVELATDLHNWSDHEAMRSGEARKILSILQKHRAGVIRVLDSKSIAIHNRTSGDIEVSFGMSDTEDDLKTIESQMAHVKATLKYENKGATEFVEATITADRSLELVMAGRSAEKQLTEEERESFTVALDIASMVGSIPKIIIDEFGSYTNFLSYLDSARDMSGIDSSSRQVSNYIYRTGLDIITRQLEQEGTQDAFAAQLFMSRYDPTGIYSIQV